MWVVYLWFKLEFLIGQHKTVFLFSLKKKEMRNSFKRYLNYYFFSVFRNFPKGIFAFGHTPSIVPLLTLLGFYKDDVGPLASNFAGSASRQFHSHKIDPFGSNVEIVLYACEEGYTNETPPGGLEWPGILNKYMVQVFLQEQPITLFDTVFNLISYEDFRRRYINSINFCNHDEICGEIVGPKSNDGNRVTNASLLPGLVLFAVTLIIKW